MICFPNAKINVGLHVLSKREDGYHNLETLLYPIGLKDALEIIPAQTGDTEQGKSMETIQVETMRAMGASTTKGYRLYQTGLPLKGAAEENLVIKALRQVKERREIPPIDIHLLKKIPSGAGLGGGSSDGAFMLRLLNDTFKLHFPEEELTRMAATLGADAPFFIGNRPALATGIGDQLEPIDLNLSGYFLLLVKPNIEISTIAAYSMVTPATPEVSIREIVRQPVSNWEKVLKNDFEPSIFKRYPAIARIKQRLYDMGALYASMSGSGSSVYAIFEEKLKEPAWRESFPDCFTWCSQPL
ncbi:MAG: 4-(cytidine 5'-diphospho)-2-C-methyl-D-erythritol kinase [Bacteroidota bacterium]|jgi:4-diphosphocytidyl-2-C-methyl-D-erythritol kinase|nr:4-(cytidine 5'-diphospho)-2-C-methyl-D-erythritol kinase [Bacteroidota bacterium]